MKGCICHFAKWQIHPFISKGTVCNCHLSAESLRYIVVSGTRLHILYLYLYIKWPVIIHYIIHSLMYAKYSTLWIFWGLAGWKLRLRPLRFFYVQLKVSQTSNLIYGVLWAPRHDIAARCLSVYGTWQSHAVTNPIINRARRCLTSVIKPTPMRQRRIPYTRSFKHKLNTYKHKISSFWALIDIILHVDIL